MDAIQHDRNDIIFVDTSSKAHLFVPERMTAHIIWGRN